MPGRKKKPFIDKKNAITFHLVHRSQKDPLQADEDAPQRVLLPSAKDAPEATNIRKKEQRKFGVFFDDDYDYMQHLKDVNELNEVEPIESVSLERNAASTKETKLQLPSTVFASKYETDTGLLNKAAPLRGPQLDWDPDIVAGLDEDFDFDDPENLLADDFVVQAMDGEVQFHEDDDDVNGDIRQSKEVTFNEEDNDIASDEAEISDVGSDFGGSFDDELSFAEEETKSRFTNYSMTSSVIRRNEGLTLIDDRFEKIYEQYDDEEIGALDEDDIAGCVPQNSDLLNSALDEFEEQIQRVTLKDTVQAHDGNMSESDSDSENDMIEVVVEEKPKEKWDCESILSTYSTLYNHPKLIEEPKKMKPIKMKRIDGAEVPAEVLTKRGLTKKQLQQLEKEQEESGRVEYIPTYRPKDETREERKARKNLVKEDRRARREEKKATKLAFKSEKQKQEKDLVNIRQTKQSVRIV